MIRALWRDSIVYAAGTVLSRGIALLLLPLLTRALSRSDYGALELIITIGVLVNLVVPLEISQALARLWTERAEGVPRRRLTGTAWTFTLTGHAVFAVLVTLAAAQIAEALLDDAAYAGAVRAGGCAIALNGVFYLLHNQFRWEQRPRAYAALSVGYASFNFVLVAIFVWGAEARLEGVLWAQAAAAAAAASLSLALLHGRLTFGIARDELVVMLRFSLPLVPAGIAVFASLYANRLMLNALTTVQDVGLFGVASRLAALITLVLVGVQGALTPLVYAHHRESETPAHLARLFEGFSAVGLVGCLALALFAPELITLLTTPEYASAAPLLGWLAAAALLMQMYIFAPGIAIAKKTYWQLVITLASALVAIGLNALLVAQLGVWGATVATLLASAVFLAAWTLVSQHFYPLPLHVGELFAAVGLFVLLGLAAPQLDLAIQPGALLALAKVGMLSAFVATLGLLGLLRPRSWIRILTRRPNMPCAE